MVFENLEITLNLKSVISKPKSYLIKLVKVMEMSVVSIFLFLMLNTT